ncbi:hypothetical protein CL684_02360 [Candidatus Campbellbacteria bacterium]|nr:hypothetical protein [Candidatus Campbellbacteria bacterium]|tara:strand:+ start:300 stop:701 length:402 start_codon:yes stop_codon:yes gene_type:complete
MINEISKIKERLDKLESVVFSKKENSLHSFSQSTNIDFSLNERAFIKRYSSNLGNGQEFTTLIVAYLSEGKEATQISSQEIKKVWERCSGLIGIPFQSIFTTRAKGNGWINPLEKRGFYELGNSWLQILDSNE